MPSRLWSCRRIATPALIAFIAGAARPPALRAQQTASTTNTTTLSSVPALAPANIRTELVQLAEWLEANGRTMQAAQAQQAREKLFYFIGSAAKAQLLSTGHLFPARDTLDLAGMFDLGNRLGVYGTGLLARALVDSSMARQLNAPVMPSEPFRLSFSAPDFTMRSASGWSVRFPYYFMIGGTSVGTPFGEFTVETLVLSTAFANHTGMPGQSQATLVVLAATPSDTTAYIDRVLGVFKLGASARVAQTSLPGGATYRGFDRTSSINTELMTLVRDGKTYVIAYSGLPGTFEANRADAMEVVRSLTTSHR